MGLLDQLLGGLAGGRPGGMGTGSPLGGGGMGGMGGSPLGGGGSQRVMMALLPVVLSMLANRGGRGANGLGGMLGGGMGGGAGGGLGGLLGGRTGPGAGGGGLGGMLGGGGMGGLGGMAAAGGLAALLQQLSQRGYDRHASSWVSTGPNEPLPPEAVSDVFDPDQLSAIASQAGVSEDEARTGLAELLPEVVDHFTPDGQVPDDDTFASRVDEYGRRWGG